MGELLFLHSKPPDAVQAATTAAAPARAVARMGAGRSPAGLAPTFHKLFVTREALEDHMQVGLVCEFIELLFDPERVVLGVEGCERAARHRNAEE